MLGKKNLSHRQILFLLHKIEKKDMYLLKCAPHFAHSKDLKYFEKFKIQSYGHLFTSKVFFYNCTLFTLFVNILRPHIWAYLWTCRNK